MLNKLSEREMGLLEPETEEQARLGNAGRITIDPNVYKEKMKQWTSGRKDEAAGVHSDRGPVALQGPALPLNRTKNATRNISYSPAERARHSIDRTVNKFKARKAAKDDEKGAAAAADGDAAMDSDDELAARVIAGRRAAEVAETKAKAATCAAAQAVASCVAAMTSAPPSPPPSPNADEGRSREGSSSGPQGRRRQHMLAATASMAAAATDEYEGRERLEQAVGQLRREALQQAWKCMTRKLLTDARLKEQRLKELRLKRLRELRESSLAAAEEEMFDFHCIRLLSFRMHRAKLSSLPDIGSRLHSSSSPLPLTALRLGSRGRLLKWLLPSLLSLPPWPTRARNSTLAAASSSAVAPTAISITTTHVAAPPPRPPSGFGAACTGSMGHWCVLLKSVAMHSNRSVLAHPFHSWVRASVDDGGIGGDGGADGGGCSDGSSESNTSSVVEAGHVIRVSLPAKSACSRSSCRRLNFPAS